MTCRVGDKSQANNTLSCILCGCRAHRVYYVISLLHGCEWETETFVTVNPPEVDSSVWHIFCYQLLWWGRASCFCSWFTGCVALASRSYTSQAAETIVAFDCCCVRAEILPKGWRCVHPAVFIKCFLMAAVGFEMFAVVVQFKNQNKISIISVSKS